MLKAVDFVQDNPFLPHALKETFRIIHRAPNPWQLAVEIVDVRQALG